MARPLSSNSRKVLRLLGGSAKSIDELRARSGIPKKRLKKLLWHLEKLGWVAEREEIRKVPMYRRLRLAPTAQAQRPVASKGRADIAGLYAAFGIRLPAKRARGRVVRRLQE